MSNPGDREAYDDRQAMAQQILAQLREAAALSKAERLTETTAELPKVTTRNGPFEGLPADPQAALKPIPGCKLWPFTEDWTKRQENPEP